MRRERQRGTTTVEFAIIGSSLMLVLFGVIEVGRAVFVMSTLAEATRRAARVAAVCPINDPAIREVGLFNAPGGGGASSIVGGLVAANFAVDYLDLNGNAIGDPNTNFTQIQFVRARIVGFQHQMLIPFLTTVFPTPAFATTLRRESLGVPREGEIDAC